MLPARPLSQRRPVASPSAPPSGPPSAPLSAPTSAPTSSLTPCSDSPTGEQPADCSLALSDGRVAEVHYSPADRPTGVRVSILNVPGRPVLVAQESLENALTQVTLQDVDRDGRQDLVVPLASSMVNTALAIWRQQEGGAFTRAGEVFGLSIERTAGGYLAVPARSSAVSWQVAFYSLGASELTPVVSVEVTAGDGGAASSVTCTVSDASGLAAAGLSPAGARTRFCAEPVVTHIFG